MELVRSTNDRKQQALLVIIMALSFLLVVSIAIYLLYGTSFEAQRQRLSDTVSDKTRLIEAVARFDAEHSSQDHPDGAKAATISQIINASKLGNFIGETGEFTMARRVGDDIQFILDWRYKQGDASRGYIKWESSLAEPMRRALQQQAGTVVAKDYRGETVLAAYGWIDSLGLGLVAKIDLKEIRRPFIISGGVTILAGISVILLAVTLYLRISRSFVERLGNSERYNRALFNQSPIGLALSRMNGELVDINPAFAKILGRSIEETLGLSYWDITPEKYADQERQQLHSLEQSSHYGPYEKEYIHRDGHLVPVSLQGMIMEQSGEKFIWSSVEDISKRKQDESELEHYREGLEDLVKERTEDLVMAKDEADMANNAKSEFLSRMSHELRTPLNAVLGFAHILTLKLKDDDEMKKHVQEIITAGNHLLTLIEEIMDLSRIDAGEIGIRLERVELGQLIDETIVFITPQAEQRGISIETSSCAGLAILADATRLKEIMLNLLSNAVKYNKENGHIKVSCREEAGYTKISVIDTGIGFSVEQKAMLFEPFSRLGAEYTGIQGTGIGMTIVKRLLELMGGQIMVDSTEGQGSRFEIWLPQHVMKKMN